MMSPLWRMGRKQAEVQVWCTLPHVGPWLAYDIDDDDDGGEM